MARSWSCVGCLLHRCEVPLNHSCMGMTMMGYRAPVDISWRFPDFGVVVRNHRAVAAEPSSRWQHFRCEGARLLQSPAAAPIAVRLVGVACMPSFRSPVASRALSAQDLASFTLQQFDTEFTAGPWKLTLSQLVRGADAASQIAAASDQNAAPPDGFDYLLFHVNATNAGQERT